MNCPVWICEPVTTTTLPTTTTSMTTTTSETTTSLFNTSTAVPVTTSQTSPDSDFGYDFSVIMNIVFSILLFICLVCLGFFLLRKKLQRNENTQITDAESVQTLETAPSVSNPNQHFGLDSDSDDMDNVPLHATNDDESTRRNPQPETFFMKCLKRAT